MANSPGTKPKSDLSPTQKHHLSRAVSRAHNAGWDGTGPDADHAPALFGSSWSSVGVPLGTREALLVRGYVTRNPAPNAGKWPLTEKGIEAGEEAYREQAGRSAGEAAAQTRQNKAKAEAEKAKAVKEIAHRFRGLKLSPKSASDGEPISLQEYIEENGPRVEMTEKDLVMLGEGIEKLRVKKVKR